MRNNRFWIILTLAVVALQILWMSNVGYALPYVPHFFVILLILFPFRYPTKLFLVYAFFTGLMIDWAYGTGGLYAVSALTFAGLRQIYLTQFKRDITGKNIRFEEWNLGQFFYRSFWAILLYETLFYFFDYLSIEALWLQAKNILLQSLTTWIFVILFYLLFIYKSPALERG